MLDFHLAISGVITGQGSLSILRFSLWQRAVFLVNSHHLRFYAPFSISFSETSFRPHFCELIEAFCRVPYASFNLSLCILYLRTCVRLVQFFCPGVFLILFSRLFSFPSIFLSAFLRDCLFYPYAFGHYS